ncbi:LPPG:FO 2-phospho-L-lactate transferase [Pseudomonas linyingensis]|uniref:LPPG:FO 2-phospho-L-lactate transferase n=1 Tax=Pseudomonas linyingensis TaxID=915471 RepID=A0A1H6ZT50_9PSED|nr:2-phospho-L-lactate transferase [Pseudomonas linyingensis]SEJ52862.1 LPPG:FO 2-phospho-L-lactate transferase [Pseudomonas linyingensis]
MTKGTIVALTGGVGGAKLAAGLARQIPASRLKLIVNTGDDFEHLGLQISPDIDTLVYTLANLVSQENGWGRADETWNFMQALGELGGETWFRLGDADLAMHIERTQRLMAGEPLSQVTAALARKLGVASAILPMTDQWVRTRVATDEGTLDFQDYFVRKACKPTVTAIRFEGADGAQPSAGVIQALEDPDLQAIIICPSNPYLSIDPLLSITDLRQRIATAAVPVIAVSPIIAGAAVKGPTAKIMKELGIAQCSLEIAQHYQGLIDGIVLDHADRHLAEQLAIPALVTNTLMRCEQDRERLAAECIAFAEQLHCRVKADT